MENFKNWLTANKKILLKSSILGVSILSFFMFFTAFFVPFYVSDTQNTQLVFIQHLNFDVNTFPFVEDMVFFFVFFVFLILSLIFLGLSIASFFAQKEDKCPSTCLYNSIANFTFSTLFFIAGFAYAMIADNNNQSQNFNYYSKANVPFILSALVLLAEAILVTFYRRSFIHTVDENGREVKPNLREKKKYDFEGLIYVGVITLLTFITLGINFLVIDVTTTVNTQSESVNVTLNSYQLLNDYGNAPSANQIIAFILILLYVVSSILLILASVAYFAKLKTYHLFVRVAVITNVAMVFALAMSGIYFSIAQEMNQDYIIQVVQQLLPDFAVDSVGIDYNIRSDFIYIFIVQFLVLLVCLWRKVLVIPKEQPVAANGEPLPNLPDASSQLLQDEMNALNKQMDQMKDDISKKQKENFDSLANSLDNLNGTLKLSKDSELNEDKNITTDPCESFSNLENRRPYFAKELEERKKTTKENFTLKTLVDFIVNYAKDSPKHLSYTRETIACFISGLGFSRLSILQGMSGTGKTSLPRVFSEAIGGECRILEVESSWKDKNELIGYYNQFSKRFIPTKFTNALYEASLNPEVMFMLVLDEMNLSRIEYYFSDFLSLMENEPDKRVLTLVNIPLVRMYQGRKVNYLSLKDNQKLPIPHNIWFVGTANNDESTFEISDKVYDRANTMDFDKRAKKIRDYIDPIPSQFVAAPTLTKLLEEAAARTSFDAENDPVIQKVEELLQPYNISFGNRILMQIERFVTIYNACFEEDRTFEAVETILLTKVVAKLRNKIVENKDSLQEKFEDLKLLKCAEFISRLNEE